MPPARSSRTLRPAKTAVSSVSSGVDDELGVEVVVHRPELLGIGCRVVRPAGQLRDLLELAGVERGVDVDAVDVEVGAVGAADPDGEDADALFRGRLRGDHRIRVLVVLAVAQKDDDRRSVIALRDGRRRRRRGRRREGVVVVRVGAAIGGRDRVERGGDSRGEGSALLGSQPVDGVGDGRGIRRGSLDRRCRNRRTPRRRSRSPKADWPRSPWPRSGRPRFGSARYPWRPCCPRRRRRG